jgi:hypothetical protein
MPISLSVLLLSRFVPSQGLVILRQTFVPAANHGRGPVRPRSQGPDSKPRIAGWGVSPLRGCHRAWPATQGGSPSIFPSSQRSPHSIIVGRETPCTGGPATACRGVLGSSPRPQVQSGAPLRNRAPRSMSRSSINPAATCRAGHRCIFGSCGPIATHESKFSRRDRL